MFSARLSFFDPTCYVRRWEQWATGGLGEYAKQLTLDDDVDGDLQSLRCRVSPSR